MRPRWMWSAPMTASNSTSEAALRGPWRARFAGLAAGLVVLALIQWIGADAISRPVFDRWQTLSPRSLAATRVAVVSIDDASIKSVGPWPWSRYTLARLTEDIAAQGATVIGIDVLMPEHDRHSPEDFVAFYPEISAAAAAELRALPSMDAAFAEVVGRAPVVLGRGGLDATPAAEPPALAVEATFAPDLPQDVRSWPRALANIPEIDIVAAGHGLLNADPDADGTIRRIPLVARVAGQATPGFALELARIAAKVETIVPEVRDGRLAAIGLGGRRIAVDRDGRMRLHFGTLPAHAEISALDLLDKSLKAKTLAGRIVLVGLSAAGTADVVPTPLAEKAYGTAVQAAAVDAILAGDSLSRPAWGDAAELALALVLSLALVFGLSRVRPLLAAALTLAICLAMGVASWLAFGHGLLLDPARPLLISVVAGGVTLAMLFAEGRRTQQRLQSALLDQRLAAARSAGELAAARGIQLGMLPTAESLRDFDARIEVAGLIEPARSIGGDFYDVVRIDAHRICVLIGDVTGKGVPAALFMALSKALTKSVLLRGLDDLGAAIGQLNDEIARDNVEDMFVTMFVGLIDTRTGMLELCSAGHENPLRVAADGKVEVLASEGGPPLAVVPDFPYQTRRMQLADGDTIVIVSDGIAEAQDPDGGFFGGERLAGVLAAWGNAGDVGGSGRSLLDAVRAFEGGGEATDDLTVLAFRYRAPAHAG